MTILSREKIKINVRVLNKYEAIRVVGNMLVQAGHVPEEYVGYMLQREEELSTFMGAGLAIPHGTNEAKSLIKSTGLAIAVCPDGIDFGDGNFAHLVVGIAAIGDDHMELLTDIAMLVSEDGMMDKLIAAASEDEILEMFQGGAGA